MNTANVLVTWKGTFEEQDVATLTSDATGLTGTTPTVTIGVGVGRRRLQHHRASGRPVAHAGRRLGALRAEHERPARQGAPDPRQGRRHHRRPTRTRPTSAPGGAYTIPAGNLFPLVAGMPQAKTRPEIYAMGFRNPFRLQVDENDVAYVSDYSPDSQTPTQFHGPPGVGRYEIVRHPANYGWPYCFKPNLPEYPWNVNLQVPMQLTTTSRSRPGRRRSRTTAATRPVSRTTTTGT